MGRGAGRGAAGGFVAEAGDGQVLLYDGGVPNKAFVLMVAAFSAMGGLLFGYDTGINGGIQVSNAFIADFCSKAYAGQDLCTCYDDSTWGDDSKPQTAPFPNSGYVYMAAEDSYPVGGGLPITSEAGWNGEGSKDGINTLDRTQTVAGDFVCAASDNPLDKSVAVDIRWPCDCYAPKESRVPPQWSADKGSYVSLLSFGAMFGCAKQPTHPHQPPRNPASHPPHTQPHTVQGD